MYDESFDFQQYLELLGYDREEIPEEIPEEVKIGLYKDAVLDLYNSSYRLMGDHPLITPSQKKNIVLNNIVSNVPYARQALGIPDLVEDESEPYRLQGLQNFLHQRVSEEFLSSDAKRYVKEYAKTIVNDTTPFVRPFMGDTTREEYIEGLYDANGLYEGMTVQDILEVNADLPPLEREEKGTDGAMAYSVDQAQKLTGKAIQGVGDAFNIDWMSDFGRSYAEKQDREIEEGGYQPKYTKSLRNTFNEDGLFASIGKVFEMSLENWAFTGLGLAGAALAPFGGIVGGTGLTVSAGTALMGGIGETVEEWEEKGVYDKEENAPLALAVGLAAASIDFLGNLLGMSVGLTKGLFGKAAKEGVKDTVAGAATKAATSAAGKAVGKKVGGEAVKNMFTKPELREWGTELMLKAVPAGMTEEVMQEATFIGSAILQGAEYESSEVLDRFLESGVVGGAMSGAVKTGQLATRQTLGTLFPQPEKADDAGTKPGTGGAVAPTPLKIGPEMNNAMVTKTVDGHIINFAGRSAFGTTLQDAVDALNRSANRGKATLDPDSIKTNPEGTVASVELENGTVTVEGDSAKADLAALVDMHNRNDNPFILKEGTTIKKTTVPNPNDPAGTPQTSYSVTSPTGRTIVGSDMVALFESLEADVSNVGNMLMDISEEKIDTKPAEVTVDLDTPLQGPKLNEDQVRKDLESQGFFVLFPKGVGPAKDRKTGEVKRTDGRVTPKRFSAYKDGIIYDVSVRKVKGSTTAIAKVSARSVLSGQKIKLDSDIETQTLRSGADSTTLTNKIKLRRPRVGVEVRATKVAGRNVYNIPTEIVERVAESVNGTVSQASPTHATVTTGDGNIINFNIDENGDVLVTVGGVTHKVKGNLSFFDPSRLDINVQSVLNVGLQGGAFEPVGTTIDKDLLLIRRKTRSGQNIDLVIDRDGRVGALTKDGDSNVALDHAEKFGPTAAAPVSQPQMAPEPPKTAQKVIESADKGQVPDQHQLTDTEQPGVILAITEDMDVLVDLGDVREAYGDQYMRGFVRINEDGHYLSDDGALYTSDINQAMIFYPSDIADQVPGDMVEVHVLMNPDHSPALVSTSESRFVSEANTHTGIIDPMYNSVQYTGEIEVVETKGSDVQADTRIVQTISSLVTSAENFPVINSLFNHIDASTGTPVSNVPGLYVNENGTIDIVQGELTEGWERRSIVYGLAMSDGSAQSSSMIQPIIDKVSTWQNSDNPAAKAIYDAIIGSGELSYQSLGDLYRHLIASNVADNPVADPDNSSPRAVHRDLIDLVTSLISARTNIASNGLQLTKGDIQVYLNGLSDQAQSTDPTEQPLAREEKAESIENTVQLTSESSEPASEHVVPFRTLGDILNDEIVQSFSDLDETLGQRLNLDSENAIIEGETNIEVRGDKNNAAMTMDRVLSSTQDTDAVGAGVLSESVRDMLRDNPNIDLAQMNPTLDDVQPFLDLLPSFIRDRIKIHTEETKQAKRIFGKNILGLFYSFLADKHIIHIKAYDRNLAEVISTIAHEAGHFGQQMWENIDILKVKTRLYDILVFDIMKKLPHYYKNNNIVRGRETRYEKGMLIDEYFAHYGLSFVDFNASAFPSGIIDLAVLEDIKKELDGEVAKLRNDLSKIFVSKSGIPKVAEGFIEDIIRATVGVTVGRGTQFSYSVDDPLTGKATVHVYTNDYGQIYDSVPEEHSALIRKQILDKYNSLTGFRKKLFKFRINNFKIPGSYWGDTVIGSKGSLMLSRIQQIAAVDYTVELRTVAQNHRELEAILHDNNIDVEVARSEGYESTFRRLGLKGKRQIELAQIADQFLVDGQTIKYKNVINIRRLLNLTSSKLADWMKASGVPQKNINEMMAQFRNLSRRFVSDWDHRMYSAHTEEGLADLREMLAHLKANPNSDALLSEQAEAAENAIAELKIKLANKQITGQQFRKAVQPHNKVLRYKKRLDALRYYKTIQLIQKTPRGQEQFRIAQQSKVIHEAMVNEINALINSVTNHRTDGDGRDKLGMYSAMHKRKLNEHLAEDQKYMEFLEEITDPFKVMIHNLDQQAKIINKLAFNIEFGEYLLTNGMAWMKNAPLDTRAGDTKIGFMEDGSFLNYIKVEPFFADHIKMEHEVNQALTENFAANIIALAKSHMTIYSIRQLVNNYIGNISVMMMGGHLLRFNQFRNASDVAAKQIVERFRYNTATMDEFKEKILRELREHRVFGGSSAQTEIMMYSNNVYEKVIGGFADIMADMGVMTNRSARNIRKKISNFINKVQEVYGYGDEWIKPLIYLNNREIAIAKYEATLERRQGESDASYKNRIEKAAVEEAARRTQMETTTWELAPMVIRKASNKRLRLIVPDFLLHNFQMLRITATQLSRLAELRQDIQEAGKIGTPAGERYLKALKSELYQRSFGAAGMSTIFALFAAGPISIAPTMLSFMASMAGGKGDDDEDDRKTADSRWYFTPTEHRSSQALLNFITGGNTIMVPIVRGEDRFKIVATNAVRQHAAYTLAPVRPATESPSVWDWGVALSQNVMDLSQEPLTMQVINSVRGKNQWGDDVGIVNAVNALASRIMVPNALKTTLGVVAGYDLDRDDKVHRMHKAFDFVGANVREYDIRDIMARLAYKVKDERNSQNNHRRRDFVKGLVDGDLMTDRQISGQIRSMMDAHERAMGDVNYVLDGARTLLTRQEMATYMYHRHKNGKWTGKETGLSRADINGLLNGQNIFDRGLITTLQNERKKLTKGAAGVKMDPEQRRIAIQNLTRAIQRYQQAIK